jgi:hypothetical protein
MKKSLLIISSFVFCAILCSPALAQKNTSCGADVTNLSVSLYKYTDATLTSTFKLQPDQVYADGSPVPYVTQKTGGNRITAQLQVNNCTFDFTLNLNLSSRYIKVDIPDMTTTAWFFNFDRVASVPITDGGTPFQNWCNGGVQKNANGSIAKNADGNYQDVYAPCGQEFDAIGNVRYFARRSAGFDLANTFSLRYQNSAIDAKSTLADNTVLVKVYHPDASTWELVPDTSSFTYASGGVFTPGTGEVSAVIDSTSNPAAVVSNPIMPFRIVVRKLQ